MNETIEKAIYRANQETQKERIAKIQGVITEYGEENFYVSFSGGKDSTVLSKLIDIALPDNQIPRVFSDTGVEFTKVRQFVKSLDDPRIIILKPAESIQRLVAENGYPFKSKEHSVLVAKYQKDGNTDSKTVGAYLDETQRNHCPAKLLYQFTDENTLPISALCCDLVKKKPLHDYSKRIGRKITITGLRQEEGGQRRRSQCLSFRNKLLRKFNPLAPVSEEFMDYLIEKYDIQLCELYYSPYNFSRTGCKGCPYNIFLQRELNTLEKYLPSERRLCEKIWKPVYDEYRKHHYRLYDWYDLATGEITWQTPLDEKRHANDLLTPEKSELARQRNPYRKDILTNLEENTDSEIKPEQSLPDLDEQKADGA